MELFDRAVFAKRLRYVRRVLLDVTIKEFSDLTGISTTSLFNYEKDLSGPNGFAVYSICKTTGVSSDWLLGLSENMYNK